MTKIARMCIGLAASSMIIGVACQGSTHHPEDAETSKMCGSVVSVHGKVVAVQDARSSDRPGYQLDNDGGVKSLPWSVRCWMFRSA